MIRQFLVVPTCVYVCMVGGWEDEGIYAQIFTYFLESPPSSPSSLVANPRTSPLRNTTRSSDEIKRPALFPHRAFSVGKYDYRTSILKIKQ